MSSELRVACVCVRVCVCCMRARAWERSQWQLRWEPGVRVWDAHGVQLCPSELAICGSGLGQPCVSARPACARLPGGVTGPPCSGTCSAFPGAAGTGAAVRVPLAAPETKRPPSGLRFRFPPALGRGSGCRAAAGRVRGPPGAGAAPPGAESEGRRALPGTYAVLPRGPGNPGTQALALPALVPTRGLRHRRSPGFRQDLGPGRASSPVFRACGAGTGAPGPGR